MEILISDDIMEPSRCFGTCTDEPCTCDIHICDNDPDFCACPKLEYWGCPTGPGLK